MNRGIEYRVYPCSLSRANYMAGIAGGGRHVWNWGRAYILDERRAYKEGRREDPPSCSYFSLGVEFTKLRHTPGYEWMLEYPHRELKYELKRLADAVREADEGVHGFPRRKFRDDYRDSFTIPVAPQIRDRKLWIPGARGGRDGFWVAIRRRGGDPYAEHGVARSVTVRRRPCGRWYASVIWEIPDADLPDDGREIGLDMNVRQVTSSDGARFDAPDLSRLERRRRKYQRREARRNKTRLLLDRKTGLPILNKKGELIRLNSKRRERARRARARIDGKIAYARRHWCHATSANLARKASTICLEDLQVQHMTKSARGTREKPGRNVRPKRGLNRAILGTAWGVIRTMLEYKVRQVVRVPAHHTSQTCHRCGFVAAGNRTSQAAFRCLSCGHTANADVNAAQNILRRGLSMLRGETPRTGVEGGTGAGRAFSSA